jgi:hypothetical protein
MRWLRDLVEECDEKLIDKHHSEMLQVTSLPVRLSNSESGSEILQLPYFDRMILCLTSEVLYSSI